MDHYSQERWMLDRHVDLARAAEAHSRLRAWRPQVRLAELAAARLRSLADRLDRPEPAFTVVSGSR
jgi:hypothetical protein